MRNSNINILIFVLLALVVLSLFSIAVSYNSAADIKLARYESDSIKSLYLAKAGIAKMAAELNRDKNNYTSLNEGWNREKEFRFWGGKVVYSASDESSRINLNSPGLSREHLIRLGLDEDISRSLLDYKIGKGDKGFEFMEELFLIDGVTADIYLRIKDHGTIYRGADSRININTAGENVLRLVLGNDLIINRIIGFRQGDDAKDGTSDDGVFTEDNFSAVFKDFGAAPETVLNYQALFSVKSDFFRILSEASFSEDKNQASPIRHCSADVGANGVSSGARRIAAVTDRYGKIYYWKDE